MTMRFLSRRQSVIAILIAVPLTLGIWTWQAALWRPKIARISSKPVLALAWSSDGQTLLCASEDGRYRELSSSTLRVVATHGNGKWWSQVQFSGDGSTLLVAESKGTSVEKWSSAPCKSLWKRTYSDANGTLSTNPKYVGALALSVHGEQWAVARERENSGEIWVWSAGENEPMGQQKDGMVYPNIVASTVAFSPDGALLASGGPGPEIEVLSRISHKKLWDGSTVWPGIASANNNILGGGFIARRLCFSPDARWLAASFDSGLTITFDSTTGRKHPLQDDMKNDECLAFSSDSRFLAGGGHDGNVEIWKVASGEQLRSFHTGSSSIQSVAFSPDCSHLAVGTSTGQVQVWRAR